MPDKVSRQVEYQRRHRALGLCAYCSAKAVTKGRCLIHASAARDWYRRKHPDAPTRESKTRVLEKKFRPPPEFINGGL